jgi:hypothetical protein
MELRIYKGAEVNENNHWLTVKKCALNSHTCCAVPFCGACGKEMPMEIHDKNGQENATIGIKKVFAGCFVEWFSAGDMYELKLPNNADDAALVIAAAQFADMLFFENPEGCNG